MANDKSTASQKVTDALDDYLLKTLEELWTIVSDPKHPDHRRFKLDALKLLLRHTAPMRKEIQPVVEQNNDISVQIANLFHGNSIEDKSKKPDIIEIEASNKDNKDE